MLINWFIAKIDTLILSLILSFKMTSFVSDLHYYENKKFKQHHSISNKNSISNQRLVLLLIITNTGIIIT